MDNQISNLIDGSETITDKLHRWPNFHDAECAELILRRSKDEAEIGPTVIAAFLIKEMVAEKLEHYLVTIKFMSVERLQLDEFNYQNAINGLEFEKAARPGWDSRPLIKVTIVPGFGINGSFNCERVKVIGFRPFLPPEHLW